MIFLKRRYIKKKNDQLIFAALLAAVFCVLAAILGLMLPTQVGVSGSFDSDLPIAGGSQTAAPAPQTTLPPVTQAPVTQPLLTAVMMLLLPLLKKLPTAMQFLRATKLSSLNTQSL